jgi:AcrR family transcriptional regulator
LETLVTKKVSLVLHTLIMETKERIVKKAHELFMLYGIRSVSMDEIAAHLGMSKKTIYQYFEDKDAIVDGVLNIEIEMNEKNFMQQQQNAENAVHEIFLDIDLIQEMLKGMNPSILFDLEKYHPTAYKKLNDHKNNFYYGIMCNNLKRGIAENVYKEDINIDILSRFRVSSIFLIFNPEVFPSLKYNLTETFWEITANFLHGLVTVKGNKLIDKYKVQSKKSKAYDK